MKIFSSSKFTPDFFLLLIILFVASVLRFWNYSQMPYMHDELSALARTHFATYSEMLNVYLREDVHPLGIQTVLFYFTKIVGENEMEIKFPFILFGIASILIAFKIASQWFTRSTSLLVAAFMASLQYFVMYSCLARPYSVGLFFSLLMVYSWSNFFFFSENKNKWLVGYVFSAVCCAYIHYFALLFAIIVALTGLFFLNRNNWKKYFLSGVLIFVFYIPHLSVFFFQFNKGGLGGSQGWLAKPNNGWLLNYFRYTFHFSYLLYLLVFILIIFSLIKMNRNIRDIQKFRIISLSWFLILFLIVYIYSVKVNPVIQYSSLYFVFPFLLMFIFSLLAEINLGWKTAIVMLVLATGTFTLIHNRKHFQIFYRQPYQQEIVNTIQVLKEIKPENDVTVQLNILPSFLNFYSHKYKFNFNGTIFNPFKDKVNCVAFHEFVDKQKTNYFVFGNPPLEYIPIIKEKYPYTFKKEEGFTYSFYCFTRLPELDNEKDKIVFSKEIISHTKECTIDSTIEFGTTFSEKVKNISMSRFNKIVVGAKISIANKFSNPTLVMDIQENGKSLYWNGAEFKNFSNGGEDTATLYIVKRFADFDLIKHPNAEIKIYIWNRNKTKVNIEFLKVEVIKDNPFIYSLYENTE